MAARHSKRDDQLTKQAKLEGKITGRSFITEPKWVGREGQNGAHYGPHEMLYGKDISQRRKEIIEATGAACSKCGAKRGFETWLELDHIIGGLGRCDCPQNIRLLCANFKGTGCHQKKHLERTAEARA